MNKFKVMFPELNENQRKQLSTLIERAIGPDTPHGSGQNVAYEAGIDWRNQMRQEIRNNLKELGVIHGDSK